MYQCVWVYLCWAEISMEPSQKTLRAMDREWGGEVAGLEDGSRISKNRVTLPALPFL